MLVNRTLFTRFWTLNHIKFTILKKGKPLSNQMSISKPRHFNWRHFLTVCPCSRPIDKTISLFLLSPRIWATSISIYLFSFGRRRSMFLLSIGIETILRVCLLHYLSSIKVLLLLHFRHFLLTSKMAYHWLPLWLLLRQRKRPTACLPWRLFSITEGKCRRSGWLRRLFKKISPEFELFLEISQIFVGHVVVSDVFITENAFIICKIWLWVGVVSFLLNFFLLLPLFHFSEAAKWRNRYIFLFRSIFLHRCLLNGRLCISSLILYLNAAANFRVIEANNAVSVSFCQLWMKSIMLTLGQRRRFLICFLQKKQKFTMCVFQRMRDSQLNNTIFLAFGVLRFEDHVPQLQSYDIFTRISHMFKYAIIQSEAHSPQLVSIRVGVPTEQYPQFTKPRELTFVKFHGLPRADVVYTHPWKIFKKSYQDL